MELIIGGFIGGVLVGILLHLFFDKRKHESGEFVVNLEDPMDETLKLNMYDSLDEICSKQHIILRVIIYGNNSLK